MRQRGPRGGPVRLRLHQRGGAHARRAGHARSCSSERCPCSPSCELLRCGRSTRTGDGLLLADARGLAGEVTQVVELGAAHAATTDDIDVGQHGAVQREDALDADAVGNLADGEAGADTRATTRDADTLERLNALLFAFL